ncbi:hypothetical protein ENSA7_25590 [Enhygromyxa salina]|uniref:Uncharacterized protein n=1 Tax=Enhygromyxa salina TaxID=215803 RepID=A0A2S9YR79_9BACT|nr:hypothetical protein ENSA7_25590 [Enhygromyxa salina]
MVKCSVNEHARGCYERLQQLLWADLSSDVELEIARHLETHDSLKSGDPTELVTLIAKELRYGMGRSPIPSIAQTSVVLFSVKGGLALLNIVIAQFWLPLAGLPLFLALHTGRVNRRYIRRALAIAGDFNTPLGPGGSQHSSENDG